MTSDRITASLKRTSLVFIILIFCNTIVAYNSPSYPKEIKQQTKLQKIYILPIAVSTTGVVEKIRTELETTFQIPTAILPSVPQIPALSYNIQRKQYHSTRLLADIRKQALPDSVRILGIVNVDLFVPELNFVFGEADVSGRAAIISLSRLHPEFYRMPPNEQLFERRAVKEAVHELGHTFGLGHCSDPRCVMFFSNHIGDTDKKSRDFCVKCKLKIDKIIAELNVTTK